MNDRAEARDPAAAAAEAVRAYVRMNREQLATDGELLALLLPRRFADEGVSDFQSYVIEKLRDENAALRAERHGLQGARARATGLGDGLKRLVLELLDARTFEEAILVATNAAPAFGADCATLCVEGDGAAPQGCDGVRLIAPGTATTVLGRDASGAILSGCGEILLGSGGAEYASLAVFRLRLGNHAPAAVYVVGAREAGCFDSDEIAADLAFFARALERSIRAWLDLPKL